MRFFSRSLFFAFCITAILPLVFGAAPVLAAENTSQFATVAPNDPLQVQLQIVRRAGWSNLGLSADPAGNTPVALTRYEMALETTKALIAVRARHNANANWDRTANLQSLRALRALCVAFKSDLTSFDVDVAATLELLDEILASTKLSSVEREKQEARRVHDARRIYDAGRDRDAGSTPSTPSETLMQSLSQKLRIYSALDSLARQQDDPFATDTPTAFSTRYSSSAYSGGVQRLRAAATFEINPSLQLRADFQNENLDAVRAPSLRDFLNGDTVDASNNPFNANSRSIGAGVDLNLLPGVTVSGGVTHVDELSRGGDALRYEGGVGLSGWQNRVALSAHLSRLVPEDSLALGTTAARLNLGVGLTSQIQLKLMYQQMFGANAALQTNPRFGGGLDFKF